MIAIFLITNIVNQSLTTREFPFLLKLSHVRPRLKKDNLDKEILKNYRPVVNIPFLSKVIEKVVATQTHNYVEASSRCCISTTWFISGLWHYWSYNLGGKTQLLLWFLKTDSMLVQILPWKPSAINSHWRSSVYSLRSAPWYPTRVYTCTIAFHPVYRPSSRCNCSP